MIYNKFCIDLLTYFGSGCPGGAGRMC